MSRWGGLIGAALVLAMTLGLAALNGTERVTLRLGFVTLYRAPLTVVILGSVFLGMAVIVVTGIHADLKVRRILRERLAREDEEEKARTLADGNQRDLFERPARPPEGAQPH